MKQHKRPDEDFCVDCFLWHLDLEKAHRDAGFPAIPREVLTRRFYSYLDFLQQKGLTIHTLVSSLKDITERTELRNSHLTDEGFEFIRRYHDRWLSRLYKDKGAEKERAFLEKWLKKMNE